MSSIDELYTGKKKPKRNKKNLIGDFDSEESSLFSTALKIEFLGLLLF